MTEDGSVPAHEHVIAAMEQSAEEYGLPRSCGRLYGVLYFADGPLSLDDLADRSGYAKSTVSDATRTLRDLYLVRQVRPPGGGRQSYFEAERDLWYAFCTAAREAGRRELELMQRALDTAERQLDAEEDPQALARIRALRETYQRVERALDTVDELSPEQLLDALARVGEMNTEESDESYPGV